MAKLACVDGWKSSSGDTSRDDSPCAWWWRRNVASSLRLGASPYDQKSWPMNSRAARSCSSTNGSVIERGKTRRLRLFECFEHRRRQPRVRLDQLASDAGDMHDRENARAFEIVPPCGDWIGKQPADIGIHLPGKAWRARRDEAVDLAAFQ